MFKIGPFTSENNPRNRAVQVAPSIDTWTAATAGTGILSPSTWIPGFFLTAAGVIGDCVADYPRRLCDRLFTINDTEAYWRGWQIEKVHSGLGRRYRAFAFDTLVLCAECQGTGIEETDIAGIVMTCDSCLGAGRLRIARADTPQRG